MSSQEANTVTKMIESNDGQTDKPTPVKKCGLRMRSKIGKIVCPRWFLTLDPPTQ